MNLRYWLVHGSSARLVEARTQGTMICRHVIDALLSNLVKRHKARCSGLSRRVCLNQLPSVRNGNNGKPVEKLDGNNFVCNKQWQ